MNEAGIKSVLRKLFFFCLPTQTMRSRFIMKHSYEFRHIGGVFFGNQDFIQQILTLYQSVTMFLLQQTYHLLHTIQ